MAKANRLKILPFAKFQSVLFALVGLLVGIIYSFGGFIIDVSVSIGWLLSDVLSTPGLSYGTLLAFGALLGMPIVFAVIGFALGIIEAVLYNLFTKHFGGIEVGFE